MGLREPFNSISHMVGAALSIFALVFLVHIAEGTLAMAAAGAYGVGLLAVYTMSSLYHGVPASPRVQSLLERLDHVAIYLLIAGSYTPVCLMLLGGTWGWSLFATVWGIALVGTVLALAVPLGPAWLHITGYIAMGWVAIIAAPVLFTKLTAGGLALLVLGGVIYTVGALFYVWDKPRIIGNMGAHELWHMFVIGGSASHFAFMAFYVF